MGRDESRYGDLGGDRLELELMFLGIKKVTVFFSS